MCEFVFVCVCVCVCVCARARARVFVCVRENQRQHTERQELPGAVFPLWQIILLHTIEVLRHQYGEMAH